jgi:hypothetical protein
MNREKVLEELDELTEEMNLNDDSIYALLH